MMNAVKLIAALALLMRSVYAFSAPGVFWWTELKRLLSTSNIERKYSADENICFAFCCAQSFSLLGG